MSPWLFFIPVQFLTSSRELSIYKLINSFLFTVSSVNLDLYLSAVIWPLLLAIKQRQIDCGGNKSHGDGDSAWKLAQNLNNAGLIWCQIAEAWYDPALDKALIPGKARQPVTFLYIWLLSRLDGRRRPCWPDWSCVGVGRSGIFLHAVFRLLKNGKRWIIPDRQSLYGQSHLHTAIYIQTYVSLSVCTIYRYMVGDRLTERLANSRRNTKSIEFTCL